MRSFEFSEGEMLLIDKPLRWTSFDVVGKLKRAIPIRKLKIGHAGTLDPLAEGLLIVCTGKFTKQIDRYQALEKEYTGTMMMGASRPSYDLETEIDQQFETSHITEADLNNAAINLLGEIEQVSPSYSALRVKGERAYELARRGEDPKLKARTITISAFEIDTSHFPEIGFRVVCSKGTYIRSLAHDFGLKLGSGAYLSSLRRTRIGEFSVEQAKKPEDLVNEIRAFYGLEPVFSADRTRHIPKNARGYHDLS